MKSCPRVLCDVLKLVLVLVVVLVDLLRRFLPAPVPELSVYVHLADVAMHLSQPSLSPLHSDWNLVNQGTTTSILLFRVL